MYCESTQGDHVQMIRKVHVTGQDEPSGIKEYLSIEDRINEESRGGNGSRFQDPTRSTFDPDPTRRPEPAFSTRTLECRLYFKRLKLRTLIYNYLWTVRLSPTGHSKVMDNYKTVVQFNSYLQL